MTTSKHQRFLYLVRHGEAKPTEEDPKRPLTKRGRRSVEQLARWMADVGLRPDAVVHSGKLRAEQTAEILASRVESSRGISSCGDMGPNDDVRRFARSLGDNKQSTIFVGHLPFLSRLVSHLVAGDADQLWVRFETAGLATLVCENGHWTIATVIHPDLLP